MLINTNYLDELTHLAWSNVISVKNVFYFSETSKMVRLFEKRERNAEAPLQNTYMAALAVVMLLQNALSYYHINLGLSLFAHRVKRSQIHGFVN